METRYSTHNVIFYLIIAIDLELVLELLAEVNV